MLVSLAIVSVLAAIVMPALTSQARKGDDAKLISTLSTLRVALIAFVSDTRRPPQRVSQLTNRIAGQNDLFGQPYGPKAVQAWRGPYFSGHLASGDSLPVGSAFLRDSLVDSSFGGSTGRLVIGTLAGLTTRAAALRLDSLIDRNNGAARGIMRWPLGATFPDGAVKLQLIRSR